MIIINSNQESGLEKFDHFLEKFNLSEFNLVKLYKISWIFENDIIDRT